MAKEVKRDETKQTLEQEAIREEYKKLVQEAPVREVQLPAATVSANEVQTIGEAIGAAEDLTDLQYAMAKLFPAALDFNTSMVARIDPHVFIPMLHLMSVDEIMRSDPKQTIDVNLIYMRNYYRLSIGLDGMGRIDTAELLGAAREEKKAMQMLRSGGI